MYAGSLLLDFFALYGGSFNFVHTGVSIADGGRYFEKLTRVQTGSGGWYTPLTIPECTLY